MTFRVAAVTSLLIGSSCHDRYLSGLRQPGQHLSGQQFRGFERDARRPQIEDEIADAQVEVRAQLPQGILRRPPGAIGARVLTEEVAQPGTKVAPRDVALKRG